MSLSSLKSKERQRWGALFKRSVCVHQVQTWKTMIKEKQSINKCISHKKISVTSSVLACFILLKWEKNTNAAVWRVKLCRKIRFITLFDITQHYCIKINQAAK